jgi:hypothetical protein
MKEMSTGSQVSHVLIAQLEHITSKASLAQVGGTIIELTSVRDKAAQLLRTARRKQCNTRPKAHPLIRQLQQGDMFMKGNECRAWQ